MYENHIEAIQGIVVDRLTAFGVSRLAGLLFTVAVYTVAYILQAAACYRIAGDRRIKHPWLAWVPLGNLWILGCISDQYQYLVRGRTKNKRKSLLILGVLTAAMAVIILVMFWEFFVYLGLQIEAEALISSLMLNMAGTLLGVILLSALLCGLAIAVLVICYMALYDLFRSCDPENSVLYMVISLAVNVFAPSFSIVQQILVFSCRKKERGMPPRKPPVVEEADQAWNYE